MKTSEFKRKVEELGFIVADKGIAFFIYENSMLDILVASVSKEKMYTMDTERYTKYRDIINGISKLQKLMYKYSRTPIKDREDEKKYLVKVPDEWKAEGYFRISHIGGLIVREYRDDELGFEFTEQEIKHYQLDSFEKVEVE